VHAYMRKRRKTEAKEKAEELESTRLRVATDNLAVLAQVRTLLSCFVATAPGESLPLAGRPTGLVHVQAPQLVMWAATKLLASRRNGCHALQAAEEPRPGQPGYNPMRAAMAAGGDPRGGMHGGGAGDGTQQGEHLHGQDGGLMLGHHGACCFAHGKARHGPGVSILGGGLELSVPGL